METCTTLNNPTINWKISEPTNKNRRYAYANWDSQSENDDILTIYDATARFYPFRFFSSCINFISVDSAQLIRSSIVRNDGFARDFGADRPVMIEIFDADLSDACEACELGADRDDVPSSLCWRRFIITSLTLLIGLEPTPEGNSFRKLLHENLCRTIRK